MQTLPWVEKYRPKTLDDITGHEHIIKMFKNYVKQLDIPHLLLYGPAGTGKTSAVMALARDLFGPQHYRTRVMEMNASDERGINVVREKIKAFANGAVTAQPGMPSFKIIILDEADSMTKDAQSALRRIIELHSNVTRFCLICNYYNKIIEPLTSRCSPCRFQPLSHTALVKKLGDVCEKENIQLTPDAADTVMKITRGDLRSSITLVQCASQLADDHVVNQRDIVNISGIVPQEVVDNMWLKLKESKTFTPIQDEVQAIINNGYSVPMLLSQMCKTLLECPGPSDDKRMNMFIVLADAEKALVDGADEQLQLLKVMSKFYQLK